MSHFTICGSLAACVLIATVATSTSQIGGSSSSSSSSAGSISGSPSRSGSMAPGTTRGSPTPGTTVSPSEPGSLGSRNNIRRGTADPGGLPSGGSGNAGPGQQPGTSGTQFPQPTQTPSTTTPAPGQELHPIQRDPQSAEPTQTDQNGPQTLGSGGKPPGGGAGDETAADDGDAGDNVKAGGSLLILTEKEREKVRSVIFSYSIAPPENANIPLRPGSIVPAHVPLKPLPPEVAKIVPDYKNYSYVVVRNQIAIVITDKREIDLLI